MSVAFDQFTPSPNTWPGVSECAIPTPMIDPMSVCELEDGSPKYHVPTFQAIAPTSSANTIASPTPGPPATRSSTGSSFMMPIATLIPPAKTPMKLKTPESTTATFGLSEFV